MSGSVGIFLTDEDHPTYDPGNLCPIRSWTKQRPSLELDITLCGLLQCAEVSKRCLVSWSRFSFLVLFQGYYGYEVFERS